MFFSKDTMIARINYRINWLQAHGEMKNKNLISALLRQRRKLEESNY